MAGFSALANSILKSFTCYYFPGCGHGVLVFFIIVVVIDLFPFCNPPSSRTDKWKSTLINHTAKILELAWRGLVRVGRFWTPISNPSILLKHTCYYC